MNVRLIPASFHGACAAAEERIYLYPGTLWAGDKAAVITTVLGSCVSVCFWSETAAGINHFILPRGGAAPSARYGNHALPMLLDRLLQLGVEKAALSAAVFGGASLTGGDNGGQSIAQRNLIEARDFLERHGIPVVREDAGGGEGRKLTFRTADGTTVVRKL